MSEVAIVVNPTAGGGRAGRVWRRLLDAEPRLGAARHALGTTSAETLDALDRHLADGARRVLALGGDGTAQLVAGRLLELGLGHDVAFGLVPAGTGSDLARCLGLPRDPLVAIRQALDAEPRPIDALELTTDSGVVRHAINIASAGLSGEVDLEVNADPGRGATKYLLSTLRAIVRFRPVPCRLELDGEPFFEGRFFVAAIANGRFFGKGMPVAPEARIDDGLADVVVIPPVPLWQLPLRLPQFLAGRHLRLPIVRFRRARQVRIEPLGELPPFDLDGETLPSEPATVRLVPGALRLAAQF